jgi:hypothetical protein
MDFAPWRLADDQQPSGTLQAQNWSGSEWQIGLTDSASTNVAQ